MRFMGATFDPSGLYRFNAVQRMLRENGLDHRRMSASCRRRSSSTARCDRGHGARRSRTAQPVAGGRALPRFSGLRSAQRWCSRARWRRNASPTCAATCCVSASASTMTKRMSTRSPQAGRRTALGVQPQASRAASLTVATSSGSSFAHTPKRRPRNTLAPMIAQATISSAKGRFLVANLALGRRLRASGSECAPPRLRNGAGSLRDRRTQLRR